MADLDISDCDFELVSYTGEKMHICIGTLRRHRYTTNKNYKHFILRTSKESP